MKIAIMETVVGAVAMSDDGDLKYSIVPKDIGYMIERALKIESGELSQEFVDLVSRVLSSDAVFIVPTELEASFLAQRNINHIVDPRNELVVKLREALPSIAIKEGLVKDEEEFNTLIYEVTAGVTRSKLRREALKRDLMAIQAIRAIDDIDKTINLFASRLREWYSVHFPELDDLVKEHEEYSKLVATLGLRPRFTVENLAKLEIKGGRAERIAKAARESIGAEVSELDMSKIKAFSEQILSLYEMRKNLSDYLEQVMKEVAPNTTELVGSLLGARLLSLAGSLEDLAKLPASTIQVLGAEKALFRALRTGGRPPKHGVIFQYSEIHKSPRWQRGKIARALATKLAIATRADFYTGRFIASRLKKLLDDRIEEVKTLYPKPPPKTPPQKPLKPARRGRK
ncbi:MAG: C/D box methylation guide ribonucleoprotein complex aNOP56 subunit [Sulfolobales archaeon]|nr:C/D box methylation guide ribonucleoprotein complex aNOP56 subunit [Sulfolobales archaeon]MDW8083261.1 C/D box methylation guide ribonucleoprotein complex aNOP56 subunit [Sulfolobales archaeon]